MTAPYPFLLLGLLPVLPLGAQATPARKSKAVKATPKAASSAKPQADLAREVIETVEENRSFAAPLPVKSRGPLGTWEQERIQVFREVKPSVVFVTTLGTGLVETQPFRFTEAQVPTGTGSGFVWDKAGHLVTNYHVVASVVAGSDAKAQVQVTLSDGKPYNAAVIGYSPAFDIAVLHVFAPLAQLKPVVAGTSRDLVVGQSVLAIGNPFGLDHSMSSGIVSALGRELPTSYGTTVKGVIQTDAAINPGNSGGPLLDSAGRLLGMNTAIAPATGASVGIGFAIPVDVLQEVVPKLIAQQKLVNKLYFGFQTMPQDVATGWLGIPKGVVVMAVDPGSPAEKAGLRAWQLEENPPKVLAEGDTILGIKGVPVENQMQLMAMLEQMPAGQALELDVHRAGQLIKIVITPERRPVPPAETPKPEKPKPVEI